MNENLSSNSEKVVSDDHKRYAARSSLRSRARNRRKSSNRLVVVLGILLTAAMTYSVFWWNTPVENPHTGEMSTKGQEIQKVYSALTNPDEALPDAFYGKSQLKVLLIGLDHVPPTPGDPGLIRRCDSIIMASTDFDTKQIRMLSIPRDGWVRHWQGRERFSFERMGHTFSLGQQYNIRHQADRDAGGIERTVDTVEHLLGESVDYYVVIQFEGMIELVDTICKDGLEVDVEKDMKYTDKAGGLYIDLKKGKQKLHGRELLGYARFRKDALGDIGRMGRQQKVLKLLLQEMMKPKNFSALPQVANILNDNIQTNLSTSQLISLALSMDNYKGESIKTKTLTSLYNLERGKEMDIPGLTLAEAREGPYHVQGIFPEHVAIAVDFLDDLEEPPVPVEPVETAPETTL